MDAMILSVLLLGFGFIVFLVILMSNIIRLNSSVNELLRLLNADQKILTDATSASIADQSAPLENSSAIIKDSKVIDTPKIEPDTPTTTNDNSITAATAAETNDTITMSEPEADEIPPPQPYTMSPWEKRTIELLEEIKDWLIVGEAWRPSWIPGEYAVAAVQLLRGAVVLLLVGLGLLIKYIYESGWLSPEICLLHGAVISLIISIIGIALLEKKYHSIGIGLVALGVAGCYLVTFVSCNIYGRIDTEVAFLIAAILSFITVVPALRYNSLLIGLLSLLAGFIAPILFNSGYDNPHGLAVWLLVLGVMTMIMTSLRRWIILTIFFALGSFAIGVIKLDYCSILWLRITFYSLLWLEICEQLLFYNLKNRREPTSLDLSLFGTFTLGPAVLMVFAINANVLYAPYAPIIPATMSLLLLSAIGVLRYFKYGSRIWFEIFAAISGILLCAAWPLFVSNIFEPAGFAALALVMAYFGLHYKSKMLNITALIGIISSIVNVQLFSAFFDDKFSGFYARLLGYGVIIVMLWIYGYMLRRFLQNKKFYKVVFGFALVGTFLYSSFEVYHYCIHTFENFRGALSVWWAFFALVMLLIGLKYQIRIIRGISLGLFGITAGKFLLFDQAMQPTLSRMLSFGGVGIAMLCGAVLYIRYADIIFRHKTNATENNESITPSAEPEK